MLDSSRQGERLPTYRSFARMGVRCLATAAVAVTCMLISSAPGSSAAQIPVNDLAPEVVGTPAVGERLVCGAGSWIGSVSGFSYVWLRDAIPVGSGVTYMVTNADKGHSLWCVVTATGSEGSAEAESANSVAIPGSKSVGPPENTAAPQVSGKPAVGETLNCSKGAWSGTPAPTFTYQWVRDAGTDETTIAAATASTHLVVSEDEGHLLACRVTATNSAGSASKLSANSLSVTATKPQDEVAPRVLGIEPAAVGGSLTCSPGTWSETPAPTFRYRWVRDAGLSGEAIIESATSSTYTVESGDQLHSLSCRVIATNSAGSSEAASSNSLGVGGSKPADIAAPRVVGTPAVGEPLTCEKGTWTGVPAPTYGYVWVRDQGMPDEEAVSSTTSSTYTPAPEDRGHSLSCDVTATNSEGSASRTTERVVVAADAGGTPPANETAPTVSGEPAPGAPLTCSEGTWSGSPAPTVAYQWLRDGSPIASATSSAYLVVEADRGHALSCSVTAINDEGIASATSSGVLEIPGSEPQEIEAPQVLGTAAVGETLRCLPGRWSGVPTPTFSYQWLRDGVDIASATADTYMVSGEDRGESISCRVIARNSAGMVEATRSNGLEIRGGQPVNMTAPEVSGAPAVGTALTCSPGTWNGEPIPTYTYQWQLTGADIPSATSSTYTVAAADRGLVLSCRVTAHNREGIESAASNGVHVPGSRPADIEAPILSGTPAVGQQLTCLRGIWNGQPPPAFTYQWLRDGKSIPSAIGGTYTVELADQGHVLSCDVTATNTEGAAEAESSNALAILRGALRSEIAPELTLAPSLDVAPAPTAAELLAGLRTQLTRAQHRARITSLQKAGLYAFSFAALARGTLAFYWYEFATGAHHSTNAKPPLLALSTTSFAGAGTKMVKLRLTSAGRHVISRGGHIALTVKGTFFPSPGRPVTFLEIVVLSR